MLGLLRCFATLSLGRFVISKQVIYGKYYTNQRGVHRDFTDNSYFVYLPPRNLLRALLPRRNKHPVIFFIFGDGWSSSPTYGPVKRQTPAIGKYIENGIAYVSLGYRSVDVRYLYDDKASIPKAAKIEELILVSPEGKLSLDTAGRTMADYKVRTSWAELITKCIYDAVTALEHMIKHADKHGIDAHRIFFFASSSGTSLVNYLTWVYHRWHPDRFTPVGMIIDTPQFNLPVNCAVGDVWKTLVEHTVPGTKLKDIVTFKYSFCERFLANIKCEGYVGQDLASLEQHPELGIMPEETCNATWNTNTFQRFCTNETYFNSLTIEQMFETQKWTTQDPGMAVIWYAAQAMRTHSLKPFHLYAASHCYNCALFDHGPMYPVAYAEWAKSVGINYTIYYRNWPGMPELDGILGPQYKEILSMRTRGMPQEVQKENVTYRSSIPWRETYKKVREAHTGSIDEHLLYICYVFGYTHCGPADTPGVFYQ